MHAVLSVAANYAVEAQLPVCCPAEADAEDLSIAQELLVLDHTALPAAQICDLDAANNS